MVNSTLSVVYIVKNGGTLFSQSLASVQSIANEIVVVDNNSTDTSAHTAQVHGARVYTNSAEHEGKLRQYALSKAHSPWILFLDHDEIVPIALAVELKISMQSYRAKHAYMIPYQNHLFGHTLKHAGETYAMLRFFKKGSVSVTDKQVHANLVTKIQTGFTKNYLNHYSYTSLIQMFVKFTMYAKKHALEKYKKNEQVTIKKIFFYAPHLFWTRFVEEKGYLDGIQRIILDIGFAYMEFITYMYLWYLHIRHSYGQK